MGATSFVKVGAEDVCAESAAAELKRRYRQSSPMRARAEVIDRGSPIRTSGGEKGAAEIEELAREEVRKGPSADVDGEQGFEEFRVSGETCEGSPLERGMPIEGEQQGGHETRSSAQVAVLGLILGEVAGMKSIAESERLVEREAEAFSGDGVDGAGGVADQRRMGVADAA
jgi:hypothetical protein